MSRANGADRKLRFAAGNLLLEMTSDVQIRLATVADAAAIAEMSKAYVEHALPWSWTPERVESAISRQSTNVVVARRTGTLLGFGIMEYADTTAHLVLLAVRSDHRRAGLGNTLVDWLEKVARTAGITGIRVEARSDNEPALGLYRKRGYRVSANVPGMYSGIEDGVRMEKALSDEASAWLAQLLRDGARLKLKDL